VLLFGIIAAASVLLFLDSWQTLAARWVQWSYGYDHGWMIAALSAWLVWRERNVLATGRPFWPGLILLAGVAAGWLLARAADVGIGQEILLPVLLWGTALTVFGPAAARALAFPLGFLYFAIPIWDFVNPFLQAATTAVVGALLALTGVTSLVEGNIVTIPAGRFEIAGGCAGVAFFMTAGALAALYGHLQYDGRWGRRLLLIAIALGGAIILNWVRVYIVILAGHLTDMQHYLVRVDHYTFGWGLFTLALLPFYVFARRMEPALTATESEHKHEPGAPATRTPASPQSRILTAVVALAVLAAAPLAWHFAVSAADRQAQFAKTPALPEAAAGWQGAGSAPTGWRPVYVGADAELGARYQRDGTAVDLWIVFYATQAQGKELVYYANHLAAPTAWRIESTQRAGGRETANDTVLVDTSGDRRLVRWWYEVDGHRSASGPMAKLQQVAARLAGRPAAALVAFSTTCKIDCTAAAATLDAFERDMNPGLGVSE
jgi:exosortase A